VGSLPEKAPPPWGGGGAGGGGGRGGVAGAAAAAVGVHDDLAAGQAGVAVGAADLKAAGGVHMHGDAGVPPRAQDGLDDFVGHLLLEVGLLLVPDGVVLGGEHDGVDPDGLVASVFHRDLALGVGAEAGDVVLAPGVGLLADQLVAEHDGQGHELLGLAAREAEHHALIAGALLVDAHRDVLALLVQGDHHGAALGVEPHVARGVADLADGAADDIRDVDIGGGGHLAGDHDQAGRHEGLAGDAGVGVLGQHGVEDGVGDLVAHLVRVAHGDRLGGKQAGLGHGGSLEVQSWHGIEGPPAPRGNRRAGHG
jgi:hypothetical protein